jgi:hypothetical protein
MGSRLWFSGSSRPARPQLVNYVITRGPTRPAGAAQGRMGTLLQPMPNTPSAAKA